MAQKKSNTKAVKDSTAKQDDKQTINNDSINISKDKETSLKTHSMTSQTAENNQEVNKRDNRGQKPIFEKVKDRLDDVVMYVAEGHDNKTIAQLLDISERSIYRLFDNPEFKEAWESGMQKRRYALEKALFKRAEGFSVQETETIQDEKGKVIKTKISDKNYVPDTTALIFTLKNIYGERYKDRVETVTDINVNINQMQQLSNEELAKMVSSNIVEADYRIE